MSKQDIQVNPEHVIESLSRQIAEQAQKIAMLESYLRQMQEQQSEEPKAVVDL
jgi:uncharacterized coiled-coil protein SlyX